MGTAARVGKKAVQIINGIVNFMVLLLVLLLFAFGCYALWDSNQVYHLADVRQYEIYKPSIEDEGQSFNDLKALNEEVFSWLTIYGTNIDYPVTQGSDNMKYVNTNAQGEYSLSGSIFLDCSNQQDFSDFNSIFFGHHMEKQTMFGEIELFADRRYFETHLYGNLYYGGENHGVEFFAFLHADAYDSSVFAPGITGELAQQAYLENLLMESKFTRDIGVTIADNIVLLSTCSSQSTNGRDILVGRITDTLYDDTFKTIETNNTGTHVTVTPQTNTKKRMPLWGIVIMLVLVVMIIRVIVIIINIYKKEQWENENNSHAKK